MIASFRSLIIYGFTFAISLGFIYFAQLTLDKGKRWPFRLYSLIGILIPCILAGLRDETVGTDVLVYAKTAFLTYKDSTLVNVILADTRKTEVGYNLLAFVASKFTDDLGGFLFLIELFVIVPVYVVLTKSRKEKGTSICEGMFVFYLLFFGQSLSIMRQSIAAAILFLAIYEFRSQKLRGILYGILAFFFHSSVAIVAPLVGAIWYLTSTKCNKYVRIFSIPVIALVFAFAFAQWQNFFQWLIDAGVVSSRYAHYLAIVSGETSRSYFYSVSLYNIAEVTLKMIFAITCVFFYKNKFEKEDIYNIKQYIFQILFASAFSIVVLVFMKTYYGYRLSMYLEYGLILVIPSFVAKFSRVGHKSVTKVSAKSLALYTMCIGYFMIVYIVGHLFGVVPFLFA